MTKWIDELENMMNESERAENTLVARQRHEDKVVAEKGEEFISEVGVALNILVDELQRRFPVAIRDGKVKRFKGAFNVEVTSRIFKVELKSEFPRGTRIVTINEVHHGDGLSPALRATEYKFEVNAPAKVRLVGSNGRQQFETPAEFADHVLSNVVTREFLRKPDR